MEHCVSVAIVYKKALYWVDFFFRFFLMLYLISGTFNILYFNSRWSSDSIVAQGMVESKWKIRVKYNNRINYNIICMSRKSLDVRAWIV